MYTKILGISLSIFFPTHMDFKNLPLAPIASNKVWLFAVAKWKSRETHLLQKPYQTFIQIFLESQDQPAGAGKHFCDMKVIR